MLPPETHAQHCIPFFKANARSRILGHKSHDTAVDLWRRLEIVAADFQDMGDVGVHLGVDAEAGVEWGGGESDEAGGEFGLEG